MMSLIKSATEDKKNIPWKLVLIFLLFSVAISLAGFYFYKSQRFRIFSEQKNNLTAIATLKTGQIEQWYQERMNDAEVIRLNESLINLIRQYFRDKGQKNTNRELTKWIESVYKNYDYRSILLADTSLKVRFSFVPSDSLTGEAIQRELLDVLRTNKIIMTDLHRSASVNYVHLDLIIPLQEPGQEDKKPFGVIILRIDPEKQLFPLIQSWPISSKSAETLLLRKEGDSILYLNELRHKKNTALNLRLPLSNQNLLGSKAARGLTGMFEGIDYRNVSVVGYLSRVSEFPWFMVAKVDKDEILIPLQKYSILIVLVVVLLVLINASIFGFWIWQQRRKHYLKQLETEVSLRELEERFTTAFRMSPVSITISSKADNKFIDVNNTFLEDMEYKREDVIARTAKELNIWADEGEREWIINEINGKGKVFGKVISYKTRTGKILYGLSSMSVIKVNGEPCNLSTVVNITESRISEEKLLESEELFRKLFENMLNGFAYCKMIYEAGHPPDFLYLNVNESFSALTGLKDVVGKKVSEAIPGVQKADPELLERYSRVAMTGKPEVFETYIESLKMWFAISVYSPQKGYFVAVFDVITGRKLAEQKLHESRATLHSIIDNSNSLIYLVDTESRFIMVNQPLQKLLTPSGEQMIGQTRDAFMPKEVADLHRKNDLEVITSGKTLIFEEENIESDGKHFYLTTKFPLYDNENNIYAVGGLSTDITERKKIENTLKESEEKFRNAFLINPDSITITSLDDGKYVSINEGFTKIFEYSAKEVLGKTPFDISIWYNPDDRRHFIESLQAEGKVENLETRFYSKSRKLVDCLVSAATITIEGVVHVLSTTRDITERKNAELALLDSEERFRTLYENVTIGIYRTTTDGNILMANPALVKMLGFDSFEQLAHRNLEHEGYEPDYPRSGFMQTIEKDGKIIGLESAWNKRNGNTLFVRESAKAMKEADGHILYIDGTVEDITDRKKTEEALRESEDKFKYVFDHSLNPKSITLPSGEINVNKAFCEMLGYQPAELKKINWADISHPEDIELTNESLNLILSGKKETVRFTKRYIHKNGSVIWVDVGTSLRRDAENNPQYFMTSVTDITERKQAEDALRESEDKFKYIFEHSALGNSITHPDGKTHFNKSFCEMLGYSAEELVKMKWQDFTHPDDFEITQKVLDSLVSRESDSPRFIKRYLKKDGSVMWADVSTSLRYDNSGKPLYFMTTVNDITDIKLAEVVLRNDEKRFRELIEALPQLYWTCRIDGPCDYLSRQWVEYTGIPESDQLGYRWLEQLHPEDKEKTISEWAEKVKTGTSFDFEFRIRRYDGEYHWFRSRAVPIHDADGNLIRWLGSNTDIDSIRKAEDQLINYNKNLEQSVILRTEQLEAANKELEAFTYSVSHDLRAPLRSVHGFTKILLEDYEAKLDEEGRRICRIIASSANLMGELIDDLLSFSRIGRTSLNPSLIDMKKMTKVLFEGMTSPSERKRIELKIGKLQHGFGDVKLLGQVWTNLISNAIKYTSKKEVAKIIVGSSVSNKMITYYIKDNGVGFDKQYAHKLFGVFQRLHSESEFEGNGVGLAIIQRIILKHGGHVWAEGEIGKGATFYFSLPVNGTGY